jgi:hypothetical protein
LVPRRFPLATLRSARKQNVQRLAAELALKVRRTRDADAVRLRREEAVRSQRDVSARVAAEESTQLERSRLRAGDLQQAACWERFARGREQAALAQLRAAESEVSVQREAESEARRALGDAYAQARAVENRYEVWRSDAVRRRENHAEAEAQDARSGGRSLGSNGDDDEAGGTE